MIPPGNMQARQATTREDERKDVTLPSRMNGNLALGHTEVKAAAVGCTAERCSGLQPPYAPRAFYGV